MKLIGFLSGFLIGIVLDYLILVYIGPYMIFWAVCILICAIAATSLITNILTGQHYGNEVQLQWNAINGEKVSTLECIGYTRRYTHDVPCAIYEITGDKGSMYWTILSRGNGRKPFHTSLSDRSIHVTITERPKDFPDSWRLVV